MISDLELDRFVPSAELRNKIAQVFGVPASEIFPELTEGAEEKPL